MLTDDKTTVRDGGLSKKADERCDIVLFYVKQSIDFDGSIHINAKKVYSKLIIDGTTNRSWWVFTQRTQWMIGPWLIIHAENDQSWRMLFKNSKERYELGRLPVKQTINQGWCILIKTFEF